MSKQRISTSLKYALWETHGFGCFYHREPVRWDELSIDHIIPEHLAEKPTELALVLKSARLPADWSLFATPNLVPSCIPCNLRKLGRVMPTNMLMLYLEQAAAKASEVEVRRERFVEARRVDRAKAQLEFALASGLISESDIGAMLAAAAAGEDLVRLTAGIELFEGVPVDQLRPSNVEQLLDTPVKLGAELPEGLTLLHNEGQTLQVRTVREYRHAIAAGYFAMTTFDMKMEAFFMNVSGALGALAACRPSSRSFIRTPRVGLCDLELIPSSLLIRFGEKTEEETTLLAAHSTIGCLVGAGHAHVARVSSSSVSIEFGSIRTTLREILRADLDSDGIEDTLVARYFNAISGTLGAGLEPVALARRSFSEPFSETHMQVSSDPE